MPAAVMWNSKLKVFNLKGEVAASLKTQGLEDGARKDK